MAYASPMKIANGLVLDFTVDNADTAADTFLGLNASGEVTKFASVPRARVSGGGNLTEATSSVLTITGGSAAVLTSGLTIQVKQASGSQAGYLSSADWTTFNNKLGTSLTSAYVYVGNGSNVATGVAISGDITLTNTGNVQIVAGAIVNADINASAAIAVSKLEALTASRVLGSDGSGIIQALNTATYPSLTELAYVKGVTSAIQTQLNNRLSVTLSSPTNGDVITYNGSAWVNSPSSTGVPTGGTTAQILRKIDNTNYNTEWHTLVASDITDVSSTAAELNKLSGVTTTSTQFNFLNTLSGNVQDQLAAKVGTSLTQNYMLVGDASNIVTPLAPGTNGYVLTSVSGVPTWVSPGVGGTVTSVAASGGTTGMSFTGSPITTSGTLTLTGTLAIANGGTGLTALGTANQLIRVNAGATALEYFTHAFGDMVLASTQTNTGTKTFLDGSFKLRNVANTFDAIFSNTNTADRTYTLPNVSGTIGLTSDLGGWLTGTLTADQTVLLNNNLRFFGIYGSPSISQPASLGIGLGVVELGVGSGAGNNGYSNARSGMQIGSNDISMKFASTSSGSFIVTDGKTTKDGIKYAASGYETNDLTLTSRGYVLGAKTYSARQTFASGNDGSILLGSHTADHTTATNGVMYYNSTANELRARINGAWVALGAGGGIGGSTGATDNSVLRADGTGGATLQNSGLIIDDSANLTLGVAALAGGTRTFGVDGSATDIGLTIYTKGAGSLEIGGGNTSLTRINHGDAATSTATRMLSLTKRTSGTAAAGFGLNQTWDIESGSGNLATAVGFTATWSVATDALETSSYVLATRKAGASFDAFSINGDNMALLSGVPANWQSMERGVYLPNRTVAPTTGIANGVALFAEDVNSSSEYFVMSESGAKVNISGLFEPVTESGTTFTLNETHRNKIVLCTNSGAITVTVNTGKAAGWNCMLVATHATGTISLSASSTTINGVTATTAQFDTLSIVHYGSENYLSKLG